MVKMSHHARLTLAPLHRAPTRLLPRFWIVQLWWTSGDNPVDRSQRFSVSHSLSAPPVSLTYSNKMFKKSSHEIIYLQELSREMWAYNYQGALLSSSCKTNQLSDGMWIKADNCSWKSAATTESTLVWIMALYRGKKMGKLLIATCGFIFLIYLKNLSLKSRLTGGGGGVEIETNRFTFLFTSNGQNSQI